MPDQPNVLILMNDQHRPDVVGYAGDSVVRTPTLDWLADTGTVFSNAYTPSPVCVPARHSMRTGKLPGNWAQDDFSDFEDPGYPTLPLQFAKQGYMTASGGKEHYQGWNQHLGWRKRIGPTPMKQHGIGQSVIPDADEEAFKRQRGLGDWKWTTSEEIKRAGVGRPRTVVQDQRVVEGIEQYIREYFIAPYYDRSQPDTPLLLKTSLIEPHYPFATDQDRFEYYLERVQPFVEPPTEIHPRLDGQMPIVPSEDVSRRELRRATAAYYGMVDRVDDLYRAVLDALEQAGENLDEWVIVFTSDHGELLGEHGAWMKRTFYEASVGVPLVIRYPKRFEPRTVDANVNLCDLYATLCDLADVPVPEGTDSRSLVPLLDGNKAVWTERYDNESISQLVSNQALRSEIDRSDLMIKRDGLKYCYYGEEYPEVLFDLDRDPDETRNFIDDPQYASTVASFRKRRGELGYGPDAGSVPDTAGYR